LTQGGSAMAFTCPGPPWRGKAPQRAATVGDFPADAI